MAKGNTLQAMLDRAKVGGDTPATPTPIVAPTSLPSRSQAGRQGTKLIGGHFVPGSQHAASHPRGRGRNDGAELAR